MLEHGSVWLCISVVTEMAFSTAKENKDTHFTKIQEM